MRGLRSVKLSTIIKLMLLILVVAVAAVFHVRSLRTVQGKGDQVNREMSDRINGASRTVYRAITDISQGEIITAELVQAETGALSDTVQELLMDAGDLGKQATVHITAGEDIHKSMVGESLEKNWQETELNCVWLSTNLEQYDYVDIRILYPNGTDYIVASKKSVQGIKLSKNNVFFWFTEDEILNVDSAIVDANLHRAKIYTTKYVDPALEPANTVNYQPSDAVIDLLNSGPNVLAEAKEHLSKVARAEMEEKLSSFKDDYTEEQKKELEDSYDFHLDTHTSAGTGEVSDNNNGADVVDEPLDSSRNDDVSDGGVE